MSTKLTLRLDHNLIRRAKSYSRRSGKSVSALVANFFALLTEDRPPEKTPLTTRVRALIGVLEGAKVTEEDYHHHLVEKHR